MTDFDPDARDAGQCGYIGDGRDSPCGLAEGWGYENTTSGFCTHHGERGGTEGNDGGNPNAEWAGIVGGHGATADPHNLKEYLKEAGDEADREWVEALTDSYIEQSPYQKTDPQAERIEMAVVMAWQERSGRAQLIKEGLERERVITASEMGTVRDLDSHHLNRVVSSLNSDIRMNLKDFDLLDDAESRKADALEEGIDLSLSDGDRSALENAFGGNA
jgi:hypothetical protein